MSPYLIARGLHATPPTVQEGVALLSSNHSPYSGDIFHEVGCSPHTHTHPPSLQQPLVLAVFQWLTSLGEWAVGTFFIVRYIPCTTRVPSLSHPYHTQSVDVLVAVCLAGITRLHTKEQVRIRRKCNFTHTLSLSLSLPQLRRQARERGSYGKGVSDILLKTDHSLPGFVATV